MYAEYLDPQECIEALNDFKVFLRMTWRHLRLPPPTRMQYHIADYLQEGHKRFQLQALRGIGKSFITGAFACWRLLRNANEKILIVSQSGGHADNIAIFIRQLINTMPILRDLIPRSNQRSSVIAFDVNGCEVSIQPSVKSLGITSQLQGNRASLLISDDVEGKNNSATEKRRVQLLDAVAEYEAILQTGDETQIAVLGTPQSSESIYNKMRDKGYVTRIFPAIYPEDVMNYHGCLAQYLLDDMARDPNLVGHTTDVRFSDEDLRLRQLSYGMSGFKLQFMLDTTLSDAEKYPLKLKDLIIMPMEPDKAPSGLIWSPQEADTIHEIQNLGFTGDRLQRSLNGGFEDMAPYQGKALVIDPSGRGKDAMGWAVVNHIHGKVYVPAFGGLMGGYGEENLIKLSEIARDYEVNIIVVESNFGDSMFEALLAPVMNSIYPCRIEGVRESVQKEARIIDRLEPLMNQHRLVLDYSHVQRDVMNALKEGGDPYYSLMFQMSHITKERGSLIHDDILDVLSLGVHWWNEQGVLKQDTNKAMAKYKNKLKEEELKRRANVFRSSQMGNRAKTPTALRGMKAFSRKR